METLRNMALRKISTALELLKNTKVKELEKQVGKLEAEMEILKEQVETIGEGKIGCLEKELKKVKGKNMVFDREIKNLRTELDDVKEDIRTRKTKELLTATERETLQQDVHDLKKSHSSLQQSIHDLKKSHSSLQQTVQNWERKVEDLERKICEPKELLNLGELCRRVQSMIFREILLKEHDDNEYYKVKIMDTHLKEAFKDNEGELEKARQRWENLKRELKLQERDVETMIYAMKQLQGRRNELAHPELTEDTLTEAATRMKDAGKDRMAGYVMMVINVWKQLKMMARDLQGQELQD